jgi:arsenate reductase
VTYERDRDVLSRAATQLAVEYDGVFTVETIERLLHESYDLLAATSKITTYLPLLTERFAGDRLRPRAARPLRRRTGHGPLRRLCARRRHQPRRRRDPHRTRPRRLQGVPQALTDEAARSADVIITMGCGDACPVYPDKRYLDWDLTDPAGKPIDQVRPIVDDIDQRARGTARGTARRPDGPARPARLIHSQRLVANVGCL